MKKIFTLFAVLLMALTMNATKVYVYPDRNPGYSSDNGNISTTISSYSSAGDTIVLADGTYVEKYSTTVDKNLVIMAAEGASPLVQHQGYYQVYATLKVIGVKFQFNGSASNGHAFYIYDSNSKYLWMENCEFFDFTQACISGSTSSGHCDSCIVNNCYFHNGSNSAIAFGQSGLANNVNLCDYLKVSNCTFANIVFAWPACVAVSNNSSQPTASSSRLFVDHCTFYNCKDASGGDHRIILSYKSPLAKVTNSIIMNPLEESETQMYGTYLYDAAAISDYNVYFQTKSSGGTVTNKITTDPLFSNAASSNFTLGNGSPALNTGTDGGNLGDPRWWPTYKRTGVANGTWGTICLPTAVSSLPSDVKFYKVNGKRMSGETPTAIVLDEVASLEAGKPYIFHVIADMSDFTLTCASSATTASAASVNGLIGTDVAKTIENRKYVIYNGEVCKVNGATVTCGAHRAYFDLSTMEETTVPAGAPGIREIPMAPEITTSMADVESEDKAIKFFQNGQLYILRDGVTYDAVGRIIR
ncbi:MAG: DUF5123 domain-containing protein [Paludibacteraceae bacterium]|nr:DUF5123 domain-containing protein [Paludibacteraceae bacterium]